MASSSSSAGGGSNSTGGSRSGGVGGAAARAGCGNPLCTFCPIVGPRGTARGGPTIMWSERRRLTPDDIWGAGGTAVAGCGIHLCPICSMASSSAGGGSSNGGGGSSAGGSSSGGGGSSAGAGGGNHQGVLDARGTSRSTAEGDPIIMWFERAGLTPIATLGARGTAGGTAGDFHVVIFSLKVGILNPGATLAEVIWHPVDPSCADLAFSSSIAAEGGVTVGGGGIYLPSALGDRSSNSGGGGAPVGDGGGDPQAALGAGGSSSSTAGGVPLFVFSIESGTVDRQNMDIDLAEMIREHLDPTSAAVAFSDREAFRLHFVEGDADMSLHAINHLKKIRRRALLYAASLDSPEEFNISAPIVEEAAIYFEFFPPVTRRFVTLTALRSADRGQNLRVKIPWVVNFHHLLPGERETASREANAMKIYCVVWGIPCECPLFG